jgi:hypothetical protein
MSLEKGKQQIIGIYENLLMNNLKGSPSISPLSYSIMDNINNKKFEFPVLLEIFSNEVTNQDKNSQVVKEEPVINVRLIDCCIII